jgi:NAD-dependent dihydropyrimidine dehydrogenase PreA subunit
VRQYDLLGVGFPVYAFSAPFHVLEYVSRLPSLRETSTFVFLTHGTYRFNAADRIRKALSRKGARDVGFFCCRGADLYLPYLKRGFLFSPDHPTARELAEAEAFGGDVAARMGDGGHAEPCKERPPSIVYRAERFLYSRWLVQKIYGRLVSMNTEKCSCCGVCMERCPVGNITLAKNGYPVWARQCLGCLTCETECPEEAITTAASWPVLRPFITYNLRHACQDPSIEHVKVTHRHGRTTRS